MEGSPNALQNFITKRKQELTKKYGSSPILYSSGQRTKVEEFPMKMKIILDAKVIVG